VPVVLGLHRRVDAQSRLELDGAVALTATVFGLTPSLSEPIPVMANTSCPVRPSDSAV
jgi:hypothetical protein